MVLISRSRRKLGKTTSASINPSLQTKMLLILVFNSLLWTPDSRRWGFKIPAQVSPCPNRTKVSSSCSCVRYCVLRTLRGWRSLWTVCYSWLGSLRSSSMCISSLPRLLNTIRQGDYYILTDDFDSCASSPEFLLFCDWFFNIRHSLPGNGWRSVCWPYRVDQEKH